MCIQMPTTSTSAQPDNETGHLEHVQSENFFFLTLVDLPAFFSDHLSGQLFWIK